MPTLREKEMSKEFDVIVIGAGPGGYVASIRASQLGLKTACLEKDTTLGGTCLNVGCIPSKALLHTTELLYQVKHHGESQGLLFKEAGVDFEKLMSRKRDVVKGLNDGIAGLFKKNGIEWFKGFAKLKDAHTVQLQRGVEAQELTAKAIILATGSEPISLPFLPFDELGPDQRIISSTGALCLTQIPKKMLIVGAGVIGLELGSVYRRLGSEILVVEMMDTICSGLDSALSKALYQSLSKQGFAFKLSTKVMSGKKTTSGVQLIVKGKEGNEESLDADVVLVSIGRKPYSDGLGLSDVGVQTDSKGFVIVDQNFRTSLDSVFAIGDLIEGPMLAHKASEEGVAVAEMIAGHQAHLNYLTIPNVVYTSPEVASVGMSEEEAKAAGLATLSGTFPFKANSRARCTGEDEGFAKVVAEKESGRLVGVHLICAHASELIIEGVLAIQKKMTLDEIANTCHAHPTFSEAIKEACLNALKRAIHI